MPTYVRSQMSFDDLQIVKECLASENHDTHADALAMATQIMTPSSRHACHCSARQVQNLAAIMLTCC